MVLTGLTFLPVLGKPLVFWVGLVTIFLFVLTALIAVLTVRGIKRFPVEWHYRIAGLALLFGLVHAVLGVAPYA